MRAIGEAALLALGDAAPTSADDQLQQLMVALHPDRDAHSWRNDPLGEVTRSLLRARSAVIGDRLDCVATCPGCAEPMSIDVTIDELCGVELDRAETVSVTQGDVTVVARAPTAADLVTASSAGTLERVRDRLIDQCIVSVVSSGGSSAVSSDALNTGMIAALGEALDELDPLADPTFALICPECGVAFEAGLDAGAFVYRELAAAGTNLLYEVDALALRYGWTEAEILALPVTRRARYLELVG